MGNETVQAQVTRRIVLAAPVQVGAPEDRVLRLCVSDESRDRYKSIIRCDGWQTDNYAKNPVVLFAHDSAEPPIGSGKGFSTTSEMRPYKTPHPRRAMDQEKQGKFSRWHADTQFAKRETYPFADIIYKLYLDKHLRATSVGFNPIESKQVNHEDQLGEDWARDLTELEIGDIVHRCQELLEYSSVPIPGNQNAVVESLQLWVPGLRSAETKTVNCVRSFLATPLITETGLADAANLDAESEFAKTCREFQGLLLLTRELMAAEPQSETKVTSGWTQEIEAVAKRFEQGAGTDSDEDPGDDLTYEPEGDDAGWNEGGVHQDQARKGAVNSHAAASKHAKHADWHDARAEKLSEAAERPTGQGQTDGSTSKDDDARASRQHGEAADQHTALQLAHAKHEDLLKKYADAKEKGKSVTSDRLARSVRDSKNDIDDKNQRLRGFYKRTRIEKPGKDAGGEDAEKALKDLVSRAPAPSTPPPALGQDPESQPDPAADQDQMDHEAGEITDREELRETLQEAISDIDDATGRIQTALGMLDEADQDDAEQMGKIRPEDAEPPNLSGPKGKAGKDDQPAPQYSVSYLQIQARFDQHHTASGEMISNDHRNAAFSSSDASGHHRTHGAFHDTMALRHGEESDKGKSHAKAGELHHDLARAYDRHTTLLHAAADLQSKLDQEKQGKAIGPNAEQPVGNMGMTVSVQRTEPIADAKRLGEMISKSGKSIVGKREHLHGHIRSMMDGGLDANPNDCRDYRSYDAPKQRERVLPSTRLIESLLAQAFQKAALEVRNQLMPCLNGLAKRSELSTFMVDLDEVKRSLRELSARSFSAKPPTPAPAPKAPAPGGEPKEPDRRVAQEHHEKLLRDTRSQAAQLLSRMDSLLAASKPPEVDPKAPKFPHMDRKPEKP
jgi:hypothetical protein